MKHLILTVCATIFLSSFYIQAQEDKMDKNNNQKQEKLHVKLQDGANPDIYVDGKKFDFDFELLDKNMIESVSVIKGEKAIEEYKAPEGVIFITTKKNKDSNKDKVSFKGKINNIKTDNVNNNPLVIIDGKKQNQNMLNKLNPENIESISVIKGKIAIKKYNSPGGVIIVKTKK